MKAGQTRSFRYCAAVGQALEPNIDGGVGGKLRFPIQQLDAVDDRGELHGIGGRGSSKRDAVCRRPKSPKARLRFGGRLLAGFRHDDFGAVVAHRLVFDHFGGPADTVAAEERVVKILVELRPLAPLYAVGEYRKS